MPNISLRKRGNSWEYRYPVTTEDGKRKQHSKGGFATKKAAEEAAQRQIDNMQPVSFLDETVPQADETLEKYLNYWMEHYCKVNLKDTTCTGYEKRIRLHILPHLGERTLNSLSPLLLQNYLNMIFKQGYSRNSISCIKGILSGALGYAVSPAGVLISNPMVSVKLPNKRARSKVASRTKQRGAITQEEWASLLARFPYEHSCHIPLLLGYHLGLRLGEAFALTWEDVDFSKNTISVKRQVQWSQEKQCWYFSDPKYDSFRTIAADPLLMEVLRRENQRQQHAKWYYAERFQQICVNEQQELGTQGTPVHLVNIRENGTYIQPRVTQHLNHIAHTELKIPQFDYHTLRHTHTTMLLEAGANPLDVQARLGHSKLAMTYHYAHNTQALQNETRKILSQIYV